MPITVYFAPESMTRAQYDNIMQRLMETGALPADGALTHEEGKLQVCDVWESREQFEAFTEKLMPIIQESGVPDTEPMIQEVYGMILNDEVKRYELSGV